MTAGRRVMGALGVVAAVGVGHLVTTHLDIDNGEVGPFVRSAAVGEVEHLSYADVQVTDVRPAKYVASAVSTEFAKLASGVFVLVSVKATSTEESTPFLWHFLVDDEGRLYQTSKRADCGEFLESKTGVPAYALYCFDVPPSRLAGMRFQIARGSPTYSDDQSDDLAEVDLGISDADAEAWAATDATYGAVSTSDDPFELKSVDLTEEDS